MRKTSLYLFSLLLHLALFSLPTPASASNIYVSATTGSDSNPGTSSAPVQTISRGISLATAGDTVYISPGTYRENIKLNSKNGTPTSPIYVVGVSTDPTAYPVLDGGDPNFSSSSKNPALTLTNCSYLSFERLKIINSTDTSYRLENSTHHISIRRNIIDYHNSGILLKSNSNHLLAEYNEFFQSYPTGSSWSDLKASKWEGGAIKSDGGAGSNIIRFNLFRRQFNSIFLTSGYLTGSYRDANVWIYRNRFVDVVDDPFEPESYAFNNHFFANTLVNTHRLATLAPATGDLLGPIYIYHNLHLIYQDPTIEASSGRTNSTFKIDFSDTHYQNGVYIFNNSVYMPNSSVNGYGLDLLSNSPLVNFTHLNNAYQLVKPMSDQFQLTLNNSLVDYDSNSASLGYAEAHGLPNTAPGFLDPSHEDLRLSPTSTLRGRATTFSRTQQPNSYWGFSADLVIPAGSDLGAYQAGANDFRAPPSPRYLTPPGGEPSGWDSGTIWPPDTFGGTNPLSGPMTSVSTGRTGDFNNDGHINLADYNLLISGFGTTYTLADYNLLVTMFGKP